MSAAGTWLLLAFVASVVLYIAIKVLQRQLFLRQLAHVRILHQLLGRGDLRRHVLVLAVALDELLQLGQLLRVRPEPGGIRLDGRVGHLRHELVVA